MRSATIAKVIPALVLAFCVFSLAFWYSSSHRIARIQTRLPGADQAPPGEENKPITRGPGAVVPGPTGGLTPLSQPGGSAPSAGASIALIPGAWPRFRGANFDNISSDAVPLASTWSAGRPKVLWQVGLGEGYAGAAVYNSRVYVLDYDRAKQADALRCFSLSDGRELWRYSYPVAIKRNHGMSRTVPAVTDKYVVTLGPKCHVLCADPMTGQAKWMIDLVKEYGTVVPEWYAGQCPLIDGDRAIIAPGGSSLMISVDCATGKVIWKTPNPERWQMTHSSIVPMVFRGKKTYVYCASGGVVGVSADNGAILWQTDQWTVKIANVPTPVVVGDGLIFLTGGYNTGSMLLQLKESGGKVAAQTIYRLKSEVFGSDQQTPIYYKGYIYGVIPGGQLACLAPTGKLIWTSGAQGRFGLGPYVIADGKIFVMNDDGLLTVAVAAPTGYKPTAQAKILEGPDAWGPIAIVGGRLIARDLNRMVCLDIGGQGR